MTTPSATVVVANEHYSGSDPSYGDATFTPVANACYLVYAASSYPGSHATWSASFTSGSGNIAAGPTSIGGEHGSDTAWYHDVQVWKFQASASPTGTSTVTISETGGATGGGLTKVVVIKVDDPHSYAGLVAQYATLASDYDTSFFGGTQHTYNLGANPASSSLLIGMTSYDDDNAGQHTSAPAGWTELYWADADPDVIFYTKTGTTSATAVQPANTAANWGFASITLELQAAPTGTLPSWGIDIGIA